MKLGIILIGMALIMSAGAARADGCRLFGLEAEQVAADRDSGLPRELAVQHLINTWVEDTNSSRIVGEDMRPIKVIEVRMIYDDMRNQRRDVIGINFETSCVNHSGSWISPGEDALDRATKDVIYRASQQATTDTLKEELRKLRDKSP